MEFSRSTRKLKHIGLIPLIDVTFFLLVFFMIAGRVEKDVFDIEVPVAVDAASRDYVPPTVFFNADGRMGVNDDLVAEEDFSTIISALLLKNPNQEIVLKADGKVAAERLIWAMNVIEQAGGTNVSLVTQVAK